MPNQNVFAVGIRFKVADYSTEEVAAPFHRCIKRFPSSTSPTLLESSRDEESRVEGQDTEKDLGHPTRLA